MLATLVVLVALLGALAAWRLSSGPVSLSFLTPAVEDAINAGMGEGAPRIALGDTVLTWGGWRRTLDIHAVGVSVLNAEGTRLAYLPEVGISFSARALLRGMLAPTRVEVIGARIALTRAPDGSLVLPAAEEGTAEDSTSAFVLLLQDLLHPPSPERSMGYLEEVRIVGAQIALADLKTTRTWRAPEADIAMFRDIAGIRAEATLALELEGMRTHVNAKAFYTAEDNEIDVAAATTTFQPSALAALDPRLARLAALRIPISGTTQLRLDGAGRLKDLDFDLSGAGGTLADATHFPEPIEVRRLRVRGRATAGFEHVDIAEATMDLGGPVLAFAGALSDLSTTPRFSVDGVIRNVPTDELRRLWPRGVGENARRWITANLTRGVIQETSVELRGSAQDSTFAGLAAERVAGALRFSGVDVNYLSPMPKVRNVNGSGTLALDRIDLKVDGGGIDNLRVGEGTIAITGLDTDVERIAIELIVRGPVREALQLVDGPPLGLVKKVGKTPASFGGDAAVRLRLRFPLLNDLKFEQIDIAASANIVNYAQKGAALGQDVTDGTLVMQVNQKGMEINGKVVMAGASAEVRLMRSFLANVPVIAQTTARTTLSAAARRALGVDAAPYVDGPVDVDLTYTELRGRRSDLLLDLGLAQTALDVPELGWRKPAGQAGAAQVRLTLAEERLSAISSFQIAAADLAARGRGSFDADGKTLRRVEVEQIKAGLTDARGSYTRAPDGIVIEVAGRSVDFGPLLRDKSPPSPERPALRVKADVARVYLAPDRAIDDVKLDAVRGAARWSAVSLQARVGGSGEARNVGISLRMEGGRHRLDATADDAGALLKALDITPNVVGGRLVVQGATETAAETDPLIGRAQIENFRVVNAPLLARVLSVALLTGINDALRGEGILFSRLDLQFAFRDPVLEVREATASGSSIGITAAGTIDIAAETVELEGTLVPAYAVNALLGKIPLVGELLVGGKGGGVFAANYKISGTIADAKVSINPLSTLAPGFLRNLFGAGGTSPTGLDPRPEPGAPEGAPPYHPP